MDEFMSLNLREFLVPAAETLVDPRMDELRRHNAWSRPSRCGCSSRSPRWREPPCPDRLPAPGPRHPRDALRPPGPITACGGVYGRIRDVDVRSSTRPSLRICTICTRATSSEPLAPRSATS
jgi:hypothetical protein